MEGGIPSIMGTDYSHFVIFFPIPASIYIYIVLQGLVDVHQLPQHVLDGGEDESFPCAKFIEI